MHKDVHCMHTFVYLCIKHTQIALAVGAYVETVKVFHTSTVPDAATYCMSPVWNASPTSASERMAEHPETQDPTQVPPPV